MLSLLFDSKLVRVHDGSGYESTCLLLLSWHAVHHQHYLDVGRRQVCGGAMARLWQSKHREAFKF